MIGATAEYWAGQGGMPQAFQLLQTMQQLHVPIGHYLQAQTIDAICKVLLIALSASTCPDVLLTCTVQMGSWAYMLLLTAGWHASC